MTLTSNGESTNGIASPMKINSNVNPIGFTREQAKGITLVNTELLKAKFFISQIRKRRSNSIMTIILGEQNKKVMENNQKMGEKPGDAWVN